MPKRRRQPIDDMIDAHVWMRGQEYCEEQRPMYYQIEGTNVRLAGSLHLVPMGATIPPWVESAYQWSEEIYMEHDTDTLPIHGFLAPGESAQTRMPTDLWAMLKNAWPANQAPLERQRFWLIMVVLAFTGVPVLLGVENLIRQRATADSRLVRHLETVEEFSQFMDGISDADCQHGLRLTLDSPADTRSRNLSDMYAAWVTNKVGAIAALVQSSPIAQTPAAMHALYEARNALWLPRITALFGSQKRILILVGAGHLGVGGGGLLGMLNDAGHATTFVQ